MMLQALGEAALRTLLLAAALRCLVWLLRVRQPRLLFTAWAVVMVVSLAMPVLQRATPLPVPIVPEMPVVMTESVPLPNALIIPAFGPDNSLGGPATPVSVLAVTYLLVGSALLLRLLLGLALSWRLALRATPIKLDWTESVRVRISRDIAAPVTFANIILLPADALTWSPLTRAAVMAHERAHVDRRDFPVLLASQLHRAVFWFSPLSWWLHRRLSSLAEFASDDRAIAATEDRSSYAAALLEMGRRPGPLLPSLAMARPATLVQRIERVLTQRTRSTSANPLRQIGLASAVLALAAMAAGTRSVTGSREALLVPLSNTANKRVDQERVSAEARQTIIAPSSIPTSQEAALLPPNSALQESRKTIQSPRPSRPLSLPIERPDPLIAQVTDRKATRATRILHDLTRPEPAAANKPAMVTSTSSRSGSTGHDPSAQLSDRKVGGDGPAGMLGDVPSCTGVYVPKVASTPSGEPLEMIEARYFKASDGSEALKISLGVRARVKLTGLDVERASVRATVITKLPTVNGLLTGAMTGLNGTLSYECHRLRT